MSIETHEPHAPQLLVRPNAWKCIAISWINLGMLWVLMKIFPEPSHSIYLIGLHLLVFSELGLITAVISWIANSGPALTIGKLGNL